MRRLRPSEIDLFPPGFQSAINMERVILIPRAHNPFALNKILVRGYRIYWPDVPHNFAGQPLIRQAVLMHELCHVWQYATGRLTALRYLMRPVNWRYRYSFHPDKSFDDYPIEKQADLLQDWYLMNRGAQPMNFSGRPPTLEQINAVVPFQWNKMPPLIA